MYRKILSLGLLFVPFLTKAQSITLLQPLDDGCETIDANAGPLGIVLAYFQCSAGFIYDVAIGFCVLWTVIGGVQIIISGDNTEWYNRGKNIIIASIGGMLTLILAPVILRFLNGVFYT